MKTVLKNLWTNGFMLSTCPQVEIKVDFIKKSLTGYTQGLI